MKEIYYEIKRHPYTFHAIVLLDKKSGVHRVKFGGKVGCVMFSIYEDEGNPNLDGLGYGKECAINQVDPRDGLLPGVGTVAMARAALAFINGIFPGKGSVYLKDQSKITCAMKRSLSLQHYYIAKHLKTWYEAKLGAKLVDDNQKSKFEQLEQLLRSKHRDDFAGFLSKYVKPSVPQKQYESLVPILEEYYKGSETYHEFLHNLAEDKDCIIFDKWLYKFMTDVTDYKFSDAMWAIPPVEDSSTTYNKTRTKPQFSFVIFGGRDPDAETWMG